MGNVDNDPATLEGELSAAGIAVEEILRLPEFARVKVVGGQGGVRRRVHNVNIMEVPDILAWVKPDELLLTTGYPLRDVPEGLPELLTGLDDAGVAALGVKLRRYLDELPPGLLDEADRLRFPVLLLPDDVAFDDLLSAVLREVLHRRSALLERNEQVHRALMAVTLEGGGLDELVQTLANRVGALALVTTTDGRVLAGSDPEALAELTTNVEVMVEGRFRSERFSAGVHDAAGASLAVARMAAGKSDHGRLVVVRRSGRFGRDDLPLLDLAASVAALVMTKTRAVQMVEAKYRGDFVRDVLQGRAGPPEDVVSHFEALGWSVSPPLVAVVASLDPLPETEGDARSVTDRDAERTAQERFADAWSGVVLRYDRTAPVVGFAQEVVALVPLQPRVDVRVTVGALVRAVGGDGGGGRRSFATGVSRVVDDPAGIPAAYEQARRAVHVGRQLQGESSVSYFDDLGAFRLLSLIEDEGELLSFVREVLHELADEQDAEAADMRATLRALLDTNFNVAETSRRLHFHYNTLRYRISKLERIVGPFTTDPDLQLDLALALRVMQIRGV